MLLKKSLAECIATFALVFFGTGAIVVNNETHGVVTHAGIAVTFGAIVTVMAFAFGNVSGAHMNPAVTLALAAEGKQNPRQTVFFIVSQLAGGLAASATLLLLFPGDELLGTTLPSGSPLQTFVLEIFLTYFLMLGIVMTQRSSSPQYTPVVAGLIVMAEAWFAGPVTGASMNPARSLAPALVSMHTEHLWIYMTAPVTGALLAVFTAKIFKQHE